MAPVAPWAPPAVNQMLTNWSIMFGGLPGFFSPFLNPFGKEWSGDGG